MTKIQFTLLAATLCVASLCPGSAANLPAAYFKRPGVQLQNQQQYETWIQTLATGAGSYTATATLNGNVMAQITATFTYEVVDPTAANPEWFLKTALSAAPKVNGNVIAGPGTTWSSTIVAQPNWIWSRTGSYSYIDFESLNDHWVAVLKTETF